MPRIIQFDPHSKTFDDILEHTAFWRTPPKDLILTSTISQIDDVVDVPTHDFNSKQKSLHLPAMLGHLIQWEIKIIKVAAYKAAKSCRQKFPGIHETFHVWCEKFKDNFCPHRQHAILTNSSHAFAVPQLRGSPQSHLAPTTVTGSSDPVSGLPSPVASQTRSLFSSTPTSSSSLSVPEATSSPQLVRPIDHSSSITIRYVKNFGIIVISVYCLALVIKRIRDPRRRADRAARREERRNRRLYRRAAQIQKWRNWAWDIQHKYWPVSRAIDIWDEKRTRVLGQEDILEVVMSDEIGALAAAHTLANCISAAEEGRNSYIYEAENSGRALERRRSVVTLPGYESEGTQPPAYDDRYRPTRSEDSTPDSSVISTSPRISRDGRDSDFEKEIEWTLDSRPSFSEPGAPFGFRGAV